MRLDHLLSREERVGVVLLLICQEADGDVRKDIGRLQRGGGQVHGVELQTRRRPEGGAGPERSGGSHILVAMRLRGTPVLIPNTKVKT